MCSTGGMLPQSLVAPISPDNHFKKMNRQRTRDRWNSIGLILSATDPRSRKAMGYRACRKKAGTIRERGRLGGRSGRTRIDGHRPETPIRDLTLCRSLSAEISAPLTLGQVAV